jgi:hypothetical protein
MGNGGEKNNAEPVVRTAPSKETWARILGLALAITGVNVAVLVGMFNSVENRTVTNEAAIVELRKDDEETQQVLKEMSQTLQEIQLILARQERAQSNKEPDR